MFTFCPQMDTWYVQRHVPLFYRSPHGWLSNRSMQVLQWKADNPGVWPFHCHIGWHLSGGLYANILENPASIAQLPMPSTSYQLCRDWATFTGSNVVDQIDSGL